MVHYRPYTCMVNKLAFIFMYNSTNVKNILYNIKWRPEKNWALCIVDNNLWSRQFDFILYFSYFIGLFWV